MSDLTKRIDALTPEQRALFQLRLRKRNPSLLKLQPIPRRQTHGPCPLSFEQERLWFVQELFPEGGAYNISTDIPFAGRLDFAALHRSLEEMVRRHEILRTAFEVHGDRPMQVVGAALAPELPVVDLSALPAAAGRRELRRRVAERARQPFVLAAGQPLRLTLFQAPHEEYVLLSSLHHIATDWWSSQIFQKELAALYADLSQRRPPSLPALPIQFADFALWQREWLPAEVRERGLLDYWTRQLAGVAESFEIPGDRWRPEMSRFQGRRQPFAVPAELAVRLRSLGRGEEASPFVVFLAAFAALLSRWCQDEEDVVVGTPVADRGRLETESLIGYFLNLLILRLRPQRDLQFRDLLHGVREVVHGAYAHQDMPFGMLLDELRPARSLNRMPFTQVAFVYVVVPEATGEPATEERAGEAAAAGDLLDPATSRVDLTLVVEDTPRGPLCFFEYSSELYDVATIRRLSGHMEALLRAVAATPSLPDSPPRGITAGVPRLADLPLLSEAELQQTVHEWSDSGREWSGWAWEGLCVAQLCEAQAARSPQATAVLFGEEAVSYAELHRRANRLAHRLRRMGIGPEARVGVLLERSIDLVVALLGVLKAGGAYVPLDATFPAERLGWMAGDAGLSLLLIEEGTKASLPAPCPVLQLDAERPSLAAESDGDPAPWALPDHPAYVLYTSGSTGRPKGVVVPHRALVNLLASMRERPGLTARDTLLAVTTISFDIAALEIFLPLAVGARLVLARREEAADGAALARLISQRGVTVLQATPSTWEVLLDSAAGELAPLQGMCGGEALAAGLALKLAARTRSFWNLYGPTETTVWSTLHRLDGGANPPPIGRPIANTRVILLDRAGGPVPPGLAGHLHVGGSGLARGYLRRPELTAERFVPDPWPAEPGARLYRTGDLARFLGDGTLEYLGRVDHQVKLRGFRIELGEIEAALDRHPGVRQAVVTVHGEGTARRLAAYFVPLETEGADSPRADELRRFLERVLPRPMIPSAFVRLAMLPLTPSGKVDRRALRAPDGRRPDLETGYRAPGGELERLVAARWQEVLGVEEVGADDNFFDLGGNSLHLVKLRQRLREEPGNDLPLNVFFRFPTVAAFARYLSDGIAGSAPEEGTVRAGVRREAQERRAQSTELRRAARRKR